MNYFQAAVVKPCYIDTLVSPFGSTPVSLRMRQRVAPQHFYGQVRRSSPGKKFDFGSEGLVRYTQQKIY